MWCNALWGFAGQSAGLRLQRGQGDEWLLFISVRRVYTEIMKEDVSWHWLNFLYWTISCESCPSAYFSLYASVRLHPHVAFIMSGSWAVVTLVQVIYELTQGERQLIDDLSLVKKVLVQPNTTTVTLHQNIFCWCKLNIFERVIPPPCTDFSHFDTLLSALHMYIYSLLTFASRCTMSPCWSWKSWQRVNLEWSLVHWTLSFLSIKVNHLSALHTFKGEHNLLIS